MGLGALAFLNPWLLAALASLPVIYWLLRTVPPRPRQVEFPPTRILVGLENREKTPAKTPWWLMLIRLLAAALVIFALAEPVLNPTQSQALKGTGPVVIAVDNGWASGPRWGEHAAMVERLIGDAEAQNRAVVVLDTAHPAKAPVAKIEAPSDARSTAAAVKPQPFAPDRKAALAALQAALESTADKTASIVWLTDGIDHGSARAFGDGLAALAAQGTFAVINDAPGREALGALAGVGKDGKLTTKVMRAGGPARDGIAYAFSARGQRLGEATFSLSPGSTQTEFTFELPLELRNQVTRVEIGSERSAGAVSLIDSRSQWQRVGLISGESQEQSQPLLAPLYYIEKAVMPFSEIVRPKDQNLAAGVDTVIKQGASVMMLADIGTLSGEVRDQVDEWVRKGGILVRFAGPRLEKGGDDLLPVPLREGGRTLGGALSWSTPQPLNAFEDSSLFAGLTVPAEIAINRQVLADPARLTPDVKVWARLKDGTPLVTAQKRGDGEIVLFHITANSDWSNLPISGLFVDMLRRITTLGNAGGIAEGADGTTTNSAEGGESAPAAAAPEALAPVETLDGFGLLRPPPPTAQAVPVAKLNDLRPSLDHPPGYYGRAGAPRAINVLQGADRIAPLPALPPAAETRSYEAGSTTPLKPWLLAIALALLFMDIIAVLILQAGLSLAALKRGAPRTAAMLLALALGAGLPADSARAQESLRTPNDEVARKATEKVTLGYVLTGDGDSDNISRLGLTGLGKILKLRTAVEPGDPSGVDILHDEIAFYPVLYWPVLPEAKSLPAPVLAKIDAYMKQGGLIIFDTKDFGNGLPSGMPMAGKSGPALQRLLGSLDIPRLEPVPEDHVLTKAFYLLRGFPGRWDGGQLWVEAQSGSSGSDESRKARRADGVTSIMITSNDFAAAWALDDRGRPIYPVVGGENQREMALRTGVNIVMHALTGNYKADQVHVPALLERLGQ